jgi:hypothetical protein
VCACACVCVCLRVRVHVLVCVCVWCVYVCVRVRNVFVRVHERTLICVRSGMCVCLDKFALLVETLLNQMLVNRLSWVCGCDCGGVHDSFQRWTMAGPWPTNQHICYGVNHVVATNCGGHDALVSVGMETSNQQASYSAWPCVSLIDPMMRRAHTCAFLLIGVPSIHMWCNNLTQFG